MLPPRVRTEVTGRRLGSVCAAATLIVVALVSGLGTTPATSPDHPRRPAAELASAPQERPTAARAGRCTGLVALSFDDGPVPVTTPRLLRVLREAGVPATFFVVGRRVRQHPELVRAIERNGFLIGNHSWAHEQLTARTDQQVRDSVIGTQRALKRAGVHPTRLMRPPYGAVNARVRRVIVGAGFTPVLWTIDSRDWANGSTQQIASRILHALRPGANIVLQHDGVDRSPLSVAAVATVVRTARRRGYCFTALDERGRPGFPAPLASVSVTPVVEGGTAVATVRLSGEAGRATSVLLVVRSGTAEVGTDLPAVRVRVRFEAGRMVARVRIPTTDDGVAEGEEQAVVAIGSPRGLRIGRSTAALSIIPPRTVVPRIWTPERLTLSRR